MSIADPSQGMLGNLKLLQLDYVLVGFKFDQLRSDWGMRRMNLL